MRWYVAVILTGCSAALPPPGTALDADAAEWTELLHGVAGSWVDGEVLAALRLAGPPHQATGEKRYASFPELDAVTRELLPMILETVGIDGTASHLRSLQAIGDTESLARAEEAVSTEASRRLDIRRSYLQTAETRVLHGVRRCGPDPYCRRDLAHAALYLAQRLLRNAAHGFQFTQCLSYTGGELGLWAHPAVFPILAVAAGADPAEVRDIVERVAIRLASTRERIEPAEHFMF